LFLRRIIHAKGLDAVADFVDAPILPTPFAVLRAAELLAEGAAGEPGWGNLLVVDVGGATTDVHSVAEEPLLPPGWIRRGLPEPRVKRTVEGDLGLRLNAETLLQAARQLGNWEIRQLGNWETGERGNWETGERGNGATLPDGPIPEFPDCLISEFPGFLQRYAAHVSRQVDHVASTEAEAFCEDLLARAAVALAVARHAGTVEELSTPTGRVFRQQGKDLSAVTAVLGTGGIFAHTHAPRWLLAPAVQEPPGARPASLRPTASRFWRDRAYCLWAGGLLREAAPGVALRLMRSSLEEV